MNLAQNKFLLLTLAGFFICAHAIAAPIKITELSEETAPVTTDLAVIVDDPSGTPATKKTTLANLSKGINASNIATGTLAIAQGGTGSGSASAARTALGLAIGTDVQAYDADLTTYAGITPSANVQSLLAAANYAAMRGLLDLEAGTDFYSISAADAAFQPLDSDLTYLAGFTPSANVKTILNAADFAAVRTALSLVVGTNVQAYDADLTTYAGITPSANVQTFLGYADFAAMKAGLSIDDLVTLSGVADGATHLGTFTGTTITDSSTIKAALQELETAVESAVGGGLLATDIDTYSELNAIVADVTLTHNGLIDTFAELDAIVADATLASSNSTNTFTNKTFDANGTGNSITNIEVADLVSGVLDTDLSSVSGSDDTVPSAKAVKAVTDTKDSVTTAGRSLTRTTNDFAADAELYTDTKTIYFESPTSSDDFKTIWTAPVAVTITKISCESDQTVNFDLQVDDGSATGVNGSDIACTTFATDSSLAGDTTMAAGDRLDLAVTSVSGTPTWVSISWEFTYDD